jgi:hypothetical protein
MRYKTPWSVEGYAEGHAETFQKPRGISWKPLVRDVAQALLPTLLAFCRQRGSRQGPSLLISALFLQEEEARQECQADRLKPNAT